MAKDDYHVIVYQILSYLYTCLKRGLPVNEDNLSWQKSRYFDIPETYWKYIMVNMVEQGFITGITLTKVWGEEYSLIPELGKCRITPKGIEFL